MNICMYAYVYVIQIDRFQLTRCVYFICKLTGANARVGFLMKFCWLLFYLPNNCLPQELKSIIK